MTPSAGPVCWAPSAGPFNHYVANHRSFRDQRQRAYKEIQWLRRRIYSVPGTGKRPKSASDWDTIIVTFDAELERIIEEMRYSGFVSVADLIDQHRANLKANLDELREEAYRSVAGINVVKEGIDPIDEHFDEKFTLWFVGYWRSAAYRDFLLAIFRSSPTVFELIDAPGFAKWHRGMIARWERCARYMRGETESW